MEPGSLCFVGLAGGCLAFRRRLWRRSAAVRRLAMLDVPSGALRALCGGLRLMESYCFGCAASFCRSRSALGKRNSKGRHSKKEVTPFCEASRTLGWPAYIPLHAQSKSVPAAWSLQRGSCPLGSSRLSTSALGYSAILEQIIPTICQEAKLANCMAKSVFHLE